MQIAPFTQWNCDAAIIARGTDAVVPNPMRRQTKKKLGDRSEQNFGHHTPFQLWKVDAIMQASSPTSHRTFMTCLSGFWERVMSHTPTAEIKIRTKNKPQQFPRNC